MGLTKEEKKKLLDKIELLCDIRVEHEQLIKTINEMIHAISLEILEDK